MRSLFDSLVGVIWQLETVTEPRFGNDVTGMRGVYFNPFAQLVDYHVQVFDFVVIVRPPDRLEKSRMRN
jgi:chromosome condensin MukBEF ATPase and DNA-binding subunit MukB